MKTILFSALLLVATMSSCSKNEVTEEVLGTANLQGDEVGLNTTTTNLRQTRGADMTTAGLETSASGVMLHINDAGTKSAGYHFTAIGSDWSQNSATPVLWKDLTFPAFFYSMHDGTPQMVTLNGDTDYTDLTDENATHDYTVTGESSTHKDLVYHASQLDDIPTSGKVNAAHTHALSKINLLAGTGENKLYVARVRLMNVDGDGSLTITAPNTVAWTTGTSNEDDYQYFYINNAAPTALQSIVGGVTTNPLLNTASNAPMMIIPQTTTAAAYTTSGDQAVFSGTYVEVIYYLTDKDDKAIAGYSAVSALPNATEYIPADQSTVLYVKAAFPLGQTFVDNKVYNLLLGFGMEDSTGGELVDDFYVDKDGNPVQLTKNGCSPDKVDIPELEPGDKILDYKNKAVDILVSSGAWGASESVNLN